MLRVLIKKFVSFSALSQGIWVRHTLNASTLIFEALRWSGLISIQTEAWILGNSKCMLLMRRMKHG